MEEPDRTPSAVSFFFFTITYGAASSRLGSLMRIVGAEMVRRRRVLTC